MTSENFEDGKIIKLMSDDTPEDDEGRMDPHMICMDNLEIAVTEQDRLLPIANG